MPQLGVVPAGGGDVDAGGDFDGLLRVEDHRLRAVGVGGDGITVIDHHGVLKIHPPDGSEGDGGVEPARLGHDVDPAAAVLPAVQLRGVHGRAAAGAALRLVGDAEEGDDHVQIVDVQIEGDQPALALVKEPAALGPLRTGGQPLEHRVQGPAVGALPHQLPQHLHLPGELEHLGHIEVYPLLLRQGEHGLGIRPGEGAGLFHDGGLAQGEALHHVVSVEEGGGADVHHVHAAGIHQVGDALIAGHAPLGGPLPPGGGGVYHARHGAAVQVEIVAVVHGAHAARAHDSDVDHGRHLTGRSRGL